MSAAARNVDGHAVRVQFQICVPSPEFLQVLRIWMRFRLAVRELYDDFRSILFRRAMPVLNRLHPPAVWHFSSCDNMAVGKKQVGQPNTVEQPECEGNHQNGRDSKANPK